jgi:hypothetical protein
MSAKVSHALGAARLLISAEAPADSAQTYFPFT